jgi:NADH:ubiquinone oxidoreductase subunit 5 (subunit L)/multisubunit Na+/H+ antiporter MnhA subunit
MGLRGCRFPDYKRVIAFSTSSQLALVAALSLVGGHTYAFIYILVHAIFKSNMFMVCGVQAHSTGNLWIGMATTGVNCICFITSICVVAMAGVSDHSTAVIKDSMLGLGVEHMYTYVFTAYALSTILYSIYLLVVRAYNAYDHGKTMLAIEYHLAILAGFLMVAVNVTNTAQSGYHMVGWSLFLLACAAGAYLHISSLDLDAAFFRRLIVEFTYLNRVRGLHTGATTYAKVAHCGYYGNKLTDWLINFFIALWILDEIVGCIIWFSIIFHDPTSVDPDFLLHDRWEERP